MEFNLGEVKESTYFQTSIQYTGSKQISYLEPSCSCMTPRYDKKSNKITLRYKAGLIDNVTLKKFGHQIISRYILIHYKDGTTEKINVKGKVIK